MYNEQHFSKNINMTKRFISLTLVIVLAFMGIAGRVGYIMLSGSYAASDGYNSYTLVIDKLLPNLYYSNGSKITNNKFSYVAVIRPNRECLFELNDFYTQKEKNEITDELSKGYPVVYKIGSDYRYKAKAIQIFRDYYSSNTCSQLINESSSGLLSYIDDKGGSNKINFSVDANGRLLSGDSGTVIDDGYSAKNGYALTLDENLQKILFDACGDMKNGCAVIMDVKTGNILACVTKPDDSYTNKPFRQYAVGSVFKIIVAVCAEENSVDIKYNCTGSITVGDTTYSCQNNHIHGEQGLREALANSCNCYFVNLSLALGYNKILTTARALGFGDTTNIFGKWNINNANLPTEDLLKSKGQLALLGFGQGTLTSTPVQICSSLCTIANSGYKNNINLVESTVNVNGGHTPYKRESPQQVLSKTACDKVVSYLRYVVTNGTGSNAEDSNKKSAGKTATAQTGQYAFGTETLNTWFAGVYPYDNPKYAIVIMTEQGTSGAENCCPIYRTVVEKISDL